MRRRRGDPLESVPPELARFDAARWRPLVAEAPPAGVEDGEAWLDYAACVLWGEARSRWAREHGWPTGVVEQLREQRAVRLSLLPGGGR